MKKITIAAIITVGLLGLTSCDEPSLEFPWDPGLTDSDIPNPKEKYVDLGLPSGTLWATMNVGAGKPEEYGNYFAWGETSYKMEYTPENYRYTGIDEELSRQNDAAYTNWGASWRIPSEEQMRELITECDWEWTSLNRVEGYWVKSRKNDNSIFLPVAGYVHGESIFSAQHCSKRSGHYWSRTRQDNGDGTLNAWSLVFGPKQISDAVFYEPKTKKDNNGNSYEYYIGADRGLSIRAVRYSSGGGSSGGGSSDYAIDKLVNDMVLVKGGTFTMGATSTSGSDAFTNEKPAHYVTLSDFYMGKYEVTQAQWQAVMGNNPSPFKGDNLPVQNVSWESCQTFITKLNKMTGKSFRLPTEAEWEYAAHGGYYSGSNTISSVAWYNGNSSGKPHEVGTKSPNGHGLYDMSGNVWEWCYGLGNYTSSNQTNPKGNGSQILRGGSFYSSAQYCRVTNRTCDYLGGTSGVPTGLRLVIQTYDESTSVEIQSILNDMVFVTGGTFKMGATSEQTGYTNNDESPVHNVLLNSFYIGKYEITQAQWQVVMGSNPSNFKGDNLPVERVSWDDCQNFIAKLNQLTGKSFRLPTEAEWEFAARGGAKSKGYKYSGSNTIGNVAWYSTNSSNKTHNVGSKQANELGLYDMSGNVYEWCSDLYGPYSSSTQNNPTGPYSGTYRVIRGGCWYVGQNDCRVSSRSYNRPSTVNSYIGLRIALSI